MSAVAYVTTSLAPGVHGAPSLVRYLYISGFLQLMSLVP